MDDKNQSLTRACAAGQLDEARRLLDAGADPNAKDAYGTGTLLTFHPAVIELLLARGADPDTQVNQNGSSVLAGLCYVNQIECVRLLLAHGADANRGRLESGETPLHHALVSREDRQPLVKLLLDHGADPNARTVPGVVTMNYGLGVRTRGETPLHRAAAYASAETIELLLAAGADPETPDCHGDTSGTWACWHLRERAIFKVLGSRKRA